MIDYAFYGSPPTFTNPLLDKQLKNDYHCLSLIYKEHHDEEDCRHQ